VTIAHAATTIHTHPRAATAAYDITQREPDPISSPPPVADAAENVPVAATTEHHTDKPATINARKQISLDRNLDPVARRFHG
jgi:hypothetical protein